MTHAHRAMTLACVIAAAFVLGCTSDGTAGTERDAGDAAALCFGAILPQPPCSVVVARPFDATSRCLGTGRNEGPFCYSCLATFPTDPVTMVCGIDPSGALFIVPKPEQFDVTAAGWHFRLPSSVIVGGGDGSEEQRACEDAYELAIGAVRSANACADAGVTIEAGRD